MSSAAMRQLMRGLAATYTPQDTDLDVHQAAVSTAMRGGAGAKALTKALDDQHAATVRRFASASTADELGELWSSTRSTGEVPGAFWTAMTHPATTPALRQRVFGDVHLLSPLVGAASRADIRRRVALKRENSELQSQVAELHTRMNGDHAQRDSQIAALQAHLAQARGYGARSKQLRGQAPPGFDRQAAVAGLAARLEHESWLTQQAETGAASRAGALVDAEGRLARSTDTLAAPQHEVHALEAELDSAAEPDSCSPLDARLDGMRLLCVGGGPSTLTSIRQVVVRAGGQWLHHDGGLADRQGLLAAMLPGAHFVVFPVDCSAHDSMLQLKRLCARHERPYRPLRTASAASFVAAMSTHDDAQALVDEAALATHFCLRNG